MDHRSTPDSDRIFRAFDFSSRKAVIVAVSGGSDSLALLLLAHDYLRRHAPATRPIAVTVDHGLRESSAAEAADVDSLCARLGIEHRTVRWDDPKPSTGIPAAARMARYRLLDAAAAAAQTDIILTGHTADDQAETVAMRRDRGDAMEDGGRGLSGMAPATLFSWQRWIVRPLLNTRREALRGMLSDRGVRWVDDPTNVNTHYERPRIRVALGEDAGAFHAALALAGDAATRRLDESRRAASLIETFATSPANGLVRLTPECLAHEDHEATLLAFRVLMAVLGGTEHLPDEARARQLLARLGDRTGRATLSRTVVDRRKSGLFLYRENRGLPVEAPVAGKVWDGRYVFEDAPEGKELSIFTPTPNSSPQGGGEAAAPLSPSPLWGGVRGGGDVSTDRVEHAVPASILQTLDATSPPSTPRLTARPILCPWHFFLPSFDLPLARTIAALIGARQPAADPFATPWRGHNGEEG